MPSTITLPRLIALCGRPTCGKTTLAEQLVNGAGYRLCDDGLPLRMIGMAQFGLTEHQVFTQEGKLEEIEVAGQVMTVRKLLGQIGMGLEEQVHPNTLPFLAHKTQHPGARYVMACVRRGQGHFWRSVGATVIEVVRPGVPESGHDFDQYDQDPIQGVVLNDGTPEQMFGRLVDLVHQIHRTPVVA